MKFFYLILITLFAFISAEKNQYGLEIMGRSNNRLTGAGLGWDLLTDSSRYSVFEPDTFLENKFTSDGRYRVPDCMVSIDEKIVSYFDQSEIIEKSSSYSTKISKSLKVSASAGFGPFKIGGSYSNDYNFMMEEQKNSRTITTSSKYYDHRYTLITNSRCKLDKKFIASVEEIRFALEELGRYDIAQYNSESLLAEYGTHYLTKVNIGAILYMDDYLSETYWNMYKSQSQVIKSSASAKFGFVFSASVSSQSSASETEKNSYRNQVKKTKIDSIGGEYKPGMSLNDWVRTIDANLVTIDREADVISKVISKTNFPNMNDNTLFQIRNLLDQKTLFYASSNARAGCTDQRSINFNPAANYEPEGFDVCKEKNKFGGVFGSTIYCDKYDSNNKCISTSYKCTNEMNLFTRERLCPPGYTAKSYLLSANPRLNLTECRGGPAIDRGMIRFGGIYSNQALNPITNAKTCPPSFVAFNLIDCEANKICLSMSENSIPDAVEFNGFIFNCDGKQNQVCPQESNTYLVNFFNNNRCKLEYCMRVKIPRPPINELPISPQPDW